VYEGFGGEQEEKRPFGISRCRKEDNTEMNRQYVELEGRSCTGLI
jgi:hypothetical protein